MNDSALITIVVPIYKVEQYLDDCVQSLINQTYNNLEIILVDDGSPDLCGKMIDKYASQDKRIIAIHKSNGGLSSARNEGIKRAKGQYIAFVDSDDTVDPLYIEKLLEIIVNHECDIAVCKFDEFKKAVVINTYREGELTFFNRDDAILAMFRNDSIGWGAWNKLYRIELFQGIEYPVGMICEDKATTYKLFIASKRIGYTHSILYHYRIRATSISGQHSKQYSFDSIRINNMIEEDISYLNNSILTNNAVAYSAKCAFGLYANALPKKHLDVMEVCVKELQRKYSSVLKADFISLPIRLLIYISGFSTQHNRILLNMNSRLFQVFNRIRSAFQVL